MKCTAIILILTHELSDSNKFNRYCQDIPFKTNKILFIFIFLSDEQACWARHNPAGLQKIC